MILCLVLHSLFCTGPLCWFISLLLSSDFYCTGVCFYSSAGACFSVYGGVLSTRRVSFPSQQVFFSRVEGFPYMHISQHGKSAPVFATWKFFLCGSCFSVIRFLWHAQVGPAFSVSLADVGCCCCIVLKHPSRKVCAGFLHVETFFCVAVAFLSSVGRTFCSGSYGMHRLDQLSLRCWMLLLHCLETSKRKKSVIYAKTKFVLSLIYTCSRC